MPISKASTSSSSLDDHPVPLLSVLSSRRESVGEADELAIAAVAGRSPVSANARPPLVAELDHAETPVAAAGRGTAGSENADQIPVIDDTDDRTARDVVDPRDESRRLRVLETFGQAGYRAAVAGSRVRFSMSVSPQMIRLACGYRIVNELRPAFLRQCAGIVEGRSTTSARTRWRASRAVAGPQVRRR